MNLTVFFWKSENRIGTDFLKEQSESVSMDDISTGGQQLTYSCKRSGRVTNQFRASLVARLYNRNDNNQ